VLNKVVAVHVIAVPVARDQLIPRLLDALNARFQREGKPPVKKWVKNARRDEDRARFLYNEPGIHPRDRALFAVASYNAGLG
jgi:hypothetical protein